MSLIEIRRKLKYEAQAIILDAQKNKLKVKNVWRAAQIVNEALNLKQSHKYTADDLYTNNIEVRLYHILFSHFGDKFIERE